MSFPVVVALTFAFALSLTVSWVRERRRRMWLERATIGLLVICVAGGFATLSAQSRKITETQKQSTQETVERRDQTCRLFEGDHLKDVQDLTRTYERLPKALDFYLRVSPKAFRPFLQASIMADLKRLEDEASVDSAPDFCDLPGERAEKLWLRSHGKQGAPPVGLPEPDPKIPQRPAGIPPG